MRIDPQQQKKNEYIMDSAALPDNDQKTIKKTPCKRREGGSERGRKIRENVELVS